ncbi:ATP-binding protein [Neptunomonas concharum]|uniref:histidine kinase n=1 Tax=Neptunomonas concharum TaxID=1031538 RepID=A0A5P1RBR7_9GAMM|nr:ATP-binding protein [Neptunomonas concharum]QEQ96732.1 HAMP domain-containing protein [Neptunomonas concharum]
MARLFITLYIGVIAALFGFILLLDLTAEKVFKDAFQEEVRRKVTSYTKLFEEIYQLAGEEAMEKAMYRTAELENQVLTVLASPETLNQPEIKALKSSGPFWGELEGDDGEAMYFWLSVNDKIYKSHDDPNSDFVKIQKLVDITAFWGFFIVTALALAAWTYLLQRKLKMLETSATAIANGDFSARAPMASKHRVGGLNRSFNSMAERIELLIASHKRLTNAVAHELRTPIFRLRCQLTMLEEDLVAPAQQPFLAGMEEDLAELDQLVEELLSYAKMQRSGTIAAFESQDVAQWLKQQQPLLQRSCLKELAVIECPSIALKFDPRLLLRALSNLVRNADIHAYTQIELHALIEDGYLVICVDDDGQGVPLSEHERIFEPFERLDVARARDTGGHGLGLSIVKEIMDIHQGRVTVSSAPIGGARFSLYLPLPDRTQT